MAVLNSKMIFYIKLSKLLKLFLDFQSFFIYVKVRLENKIIIIIINKHL